MRLTTLPPRVQLALTIGLPLLSVLIAFAVVWPHIAHLRQVRQEITKTQQTIVQKKQVIQQVVATAGGRSLAQAVVEPSEQEPIDFLKQLADLTLRSGTTITAVRALGSPRPVAAQPKDDTYGTQVRPQTPPAAGSASPGQRPVVSATTVRELQNQVTVEGTFASILGLLVRLENYDRLLSVSNCHLRTKGARSYPQLQAVFTLSRFVAAKTPAKAPAAGAGATPPVAVQ